MPSPTPRLRLALSLAPFAALAVIAACSSSSQARTCTVNADCASGQCRADGTCAPIDGTGEAGTTSDGGSDTDGSIADAGTDSPAIPLLDSGLCTPNADGIITAEEVPLRAGLKGTFRVTTSGAQISTAGTVAEGGATHNWDFSGNLTGDHSVVVETIPLAGQWFESEFSGAGYASPYASGGDMGAYGGGAAPGAYAPGPPGGPPPGAQVGADARVAALQRDVDALALFARTLLTVMVERQVLTMEQFQEAKRRLDMMDGKLDDR